MAIEKMRVANFKSFKEMEIELGQFNVLIGANASGKSNFVQIFRFLRDITKNGLGDAISLQRGPEYLLNTQEAGSTAKLSFEIVARQEGNFDFQLAAGRSTRRTIRAKVQEVAYRFTLDFEGRQDEELYTIVQDEARLKGRFFEINDEYEERELGSGEFLSSVVNREIKHRLMVEGTVVKEEVVPPFTAIPQRLLPDGLLLDWLFPPIAAFLFPYLERTRDLARSLSRLHDLPVAIYDFDPKLAKEGVAASKRGLAEDGSNLAMVLNNILLNREEKRAFLNFLKDLLPFVENLTVEPSLDQVIPQVHLQETYSDKYLPASLLSDGTMGIAALIAALYFDEKSLIIIEEPERNIHPHLISKVVHMLKEASQKKQIIITTHSPEIVKYTGLDDLLLISRDKEGFSTISRPRDKEAIKVFLEHDLGLEDLYIHDLLGV